MRRPERVCREVLWMLPKGGGMEVEEGFAWIKLPNGTWTIGQYRDGNWDICGSDCEYYPHEVVVGPAVRAERIRLAEIKETND